MKKLSIYAAALVLFAGTAELLPSPSPSAGGDVNLNAAFRDGLYLGKLTAQRGGRFHVASGRWARDSDRVLFAAGYQRAYGESLAALTSTKPHHRN